MTRNMYIQTKLYHITNVPDGTGKLEGRMLFAHTPRQGAPKSKVNEVLIANVRKQIKEDPNVSIHEISSELDIYLGTTHCVLHKELGLHKIQCFSTHNRETVFLQVVSEIIDHCPQVLPES